MGLLVFRFTLPTVDGEEKTDPPLTLRVAVMYDVHTLKIIRMECNSDLLRGLSHRTVDNRLTLFEMAAGWAELAVGVSGVGAFHEEDLAVFSEQDIDVNDAAVTFRHRSPRNIWLGREGGSSAGADEVRVCA